MLQSGVSYGLVWGSIINWFGMVLGAQVAYEVTRRSFITSGRVLSIVDKYKESVWFQRLDRYGNKGLFFFRLIPFAPNDVLSLLSGVLLLPRKGFFLVSLITAIPYAIIFAYFGDQGSEWITASLLLIINITLMSVSLIILLVNWRMNRSLKVQKASED